MQSKAAIGRHPLHPALVALPIGCFFLSLAGDVAHLLTHDPFWYRFALVALCAGLVTALPAAAAGLIDYFGVDMGPVAGTLAQRHLVLNVVALAADGASVALRWNGGALGNGRFGLAMGLATAAFATLGASGWIGGKLVFEHRVAVAEQPRRPVAQPAPARRKAS